jgi:prophage antirepressor-like protein
MNKLIPFDLQGRAVRAVDHDGEPWLVGADVAGALGDVNPQRAAPAEAKLGRGVLAVSETPSLDLLPADHVRLLHPEGRRGVATIVQRDPVWLERAIPLADLPAFAATMRGAVDVFVSQQSFYGWRRISQLAHLGAAYVDIDYRTTAWAGETPERVTYAVQLALQDARVPPPSYILATGRGLLATWLHDMVPRAALPRWMAVQQRLADVLRPLGADLRALDAARVFRLSGTIHGGVGALVRPVWSVVPFDRLWRWNFEDLAQEVLPLERAELIVLGARRAERAARGEGPTPTRHLTAATFWETVLADLQRLRTRRWFGNLPAGQRDTWLFLAGTAMSWLAPPFALERELRALAAEIGGWDSHECDSRMASVFRRAKLAAAGGVSKWRGKLVDPRYRCKAATAVDWLAITPTEMRDAGLRVLIDQDRARELAAERQTAHRRRAGVQERGAYEVAAAVRAGEAAALRSSGLSWAKVATQMGLPSADSARKLTTRRSPA